jgi:hypothetical protein
VARYRATFSPAGNLAARHIAMTALPASRASGPGGNALAVATLAIVTSIALNINGREVGSYDTQPTKFAARELALRHTLTLDRVVAAAPALADRPGFARSRDGHYRSAYSVVPSIIAAGPAWLLSAVGILDLEAPLAPAIIAKLTASLLVTIAVVLAYFVARRRAGAVAAAVIAAGYGLGTNVWLSAQTLGAHETVIATMTAAVLCLTAPGSEWRGWRAWVATAMLGVAGAARPQLAPAIAVLLLSIIVRGGGRPRDWLPISLVAFGAALVVGFNLRWFGSPLGAAPRLEMLHPAVHAVTGTFSTHPWTGAAGLLVSPSRGLLVFSPIVLIAAGGLGSAWREGRRGPLGWLLLAAFAQFALYASYTVWWGGHTYGPRYCVDLLPLLVPIASAAVPSIGRSRLTKVACFVALAWSVLLAATGALAYPAERWNTDPTEIDRDHARLWDWRDPQFARCWTGGFSPENFNLFSGLRSSVPR